MMLIEESPVADAMLPAEEFKAHLRLGSGFTTDTLQDEVLRGFLRAALAVIEGETGKVLLERSFRWNVTRWRDGMGQALPVSPIVTLSEIEIVALDGSRNAVAPDAYWLEQDVIAPVLRPVGACLPTIPRGGRAELRFLAGYGAEWTALPPDLQQAVFLLAGHYYEHRHETSVREGRMPFGVSCLIERYRNVRLYVGDAS